MAAAVSFSVLRIPVQVTDSLVPLLQVQATSSAVGVFRGILGEEAFLRPVFWTEVRLLFDVAAGRHYFIVYKAFHLLLLGVLFFCFVRAARVHTRCDSAALLFALLILTGLHTFRGMVWEAYPVNHYLQVAVCCTGALLLSQSRGGWWADLMAGTLFAIASLTLESGLIVWVVFAASRLVGWRGVSWKGIALATLLLGAYMYLRFGYLDTGTPGLDERATGFGLGRLDRDEVVARFADAPYVLYAYNIASSVVSVVLSEPRGGTWEITRRWLDGEMTPSMIVALSSSLIATGFIVRHVATRLRLWLAGSFDHDDQLVVVFLAVLIANAVLSYGYTKDEIMSTAGVFYALAAFAAARAALARFAPNPRRPLAVATMAVLLLLASSTWAIRATGLHYHMYYSGYYLRNEWATVEDWLREQQIEVKSSEGSQLVEALRAHALEMPMLNPYFLPRWAERWFD